MPSLPSPRRCARSSSTARVSSARRSAASRLPAQDPASSVNKVIGQGPEHSLMYGRDLAAHPAILGDEGAITVVAVGEGVPDRFAVDTRYAVQPAVDVAPVTNCEWYVNGGEGMRKVALGYTLPGLLAEYVLVTRETIDSGCLIPLGDAPVPAAHAAIAEPISCVISAHAHHLHIEQPDPTAPRRALVGLRPSGIMVVILSSGAMADDVIVAAGSSRAVESAQRLVGRYGVLDLFGGLSADDAIVGLDGRAVHYGEFAVTGSSGGGPHDLAVAVDLMAAGRIDPGLHISHVGDLEHTPDFIAMIRDRSNDGKAVVYPNLCLPLIREVERWGAADEQTHAGAR
jgi:threonine dehydrogenase-like Zn-dependent dehydrogenase